ncbi:MAG: peptidoglycan DD-metalloendopeptidase family protein [Alphaproteobacteria bacterium]
MRRFSLVLLAGVAACAQQAPASVVNGYTKAEQSSWPFAYAVDPDAPPATLPAVPTTASVVEDLPPATLERPSIAGSQEIEPLRIASARAVESDVVAPQKPKVQVPVIQKPVVAKPAIPAVAKVEKPAFKLTERASAPTTTAPTATSYTVAKGDTLYSLARTHKLSVSELMAANNLKSPADLKVGKTLRIPQKGSALQVPTAIEKVAEVEKKMAAIEPAAGFIKPTAAPTPTYKTHNVGKAETLYRIGKQYGVSPLDIMAANEIDKPEALKTGMVLRIPLKGVEMPVEAAPVKSLETPAAPVQEPAPAAKVVEKAAPKVAQFNRSLMNQKGMVWPAQGKVISTFGQQSEGIAHTGIAIRLAENTPVYAAESGTVIYADDGLRSYGKMVMLRHANGIVTAYAHNNDVKVRKNQQVKKGELIALSGATGGVTEPQLHFEVRRNAQAVNPLAMLPKR